MNKDFWLELVLLPVRGKVVKPFHQIFQKPKPCFVVPYIAAWPLIYLPVWYRVVRSMPFKNHVDSSLMTVLILRTVFLTNICIYTQKFIVKLSVIILQVSLEERELQEDVGLNDWSRSKWEVILINPRQCPNNSSLHFSVTKQIGYFAQLSLQH